MFLGIHLTRFRLIRADNQEGGHYLVLDFKDTSSPLRLWGITSKANISGSLL